MLTGGTRCGLKPLLALKEGHTVLRMQMHLPQPRLRDEVPVFAFEALRILSPRDVALVTLGASAPLVV